MDFDFPYARWLFYQDINNLQANGAEGNNDVEEHQRRRRVRRVVTDRTNPFVAMEDQEFKTRFRLHKDTMHELIQEIQDELLVTRDRKCVPIPPHLQVLIAVASIANGSHQTGNEAQEYAPGHARNIAGHVKREHIVRTYF
ncbi:hypothetical protein Pmani_019861 [Petrolisthes manimaculis]|uniref:Uncharacterized protein n=1 Tax=Petrolisthes manimaculis TaxID=1843537 RepID=A0AAE1PJJ9_9EUCA|nr:hypothetical protein Pmani_019861 [Petrolisthes manimaculis]